MCHIDIVSSELVVSSDVIVFAMGSFFGSVMLNLLVTMVGRAILPCPSPKAYVPNTGVRGAGGELNNPSHRLWPFAR